MQFSFFTGLTYKPRGPASGWPLRPSLHDQQAAENALTPFLELCDLADALGFDWISTPEHHYKPFLSPNPLLVSSILSQRGYRAGLAIMGLVLSGRDPVSTAEDIATLDQFTRGKALFGLFRGFANEQITFDIPPDQFRERFEESVDLVLNALTYDEPFSWQGRHHRRRTIAVWPRPVQAPAASIMVSGHSLRSVQFAALRRLSIGLGHLPVEEAGRLADAYRHEASLAGWTPSPRNILYHADLHLAATNGEARRQVREHGLGILPNSLGGAGRRPDAVRAALGETQAANHPEGYPVLRFCGAPDQVYDQIAAARDRIGFGTLSTVFRVSGPARGDSIRAMHLFAQDVMPRLRADSKAAA